MLRHLSLVEKLRNRLGKLVAYWQPSRLSGLTMNTADQTVLNMKLKSERAGTKQHLNGTPLLTAVMVLEFFRF